MPVKVNIVADYTALDFDWSIAAFFSKCFCMFVKRYI